MSGTQLISVTSVLDVLAKDAVTQWATYRVADEFLSAPDYWASEAARDRRDCRNRLAGSRYRPDRDPDTGAQYEHTAAQLGTFVHDAAEQWALSGHRPKAVHPDVEPFLDRLGEFLDRYQPEWVASEYTLVNATYGYAGRGDGIVRIDGTLFVIDWKGLAVGTPVPTPSGWKTMGTLAVGDEVFGRDGRPCRVTGKSRSQWKRCYRIIFDDATDIICDEDHLWICRPSKGSPKVKRAEQVLATKDLRPGWLVRNAEPLELPEADLPIDPYVLGAWLGDGTAENGAISKPDERLWAEIARCGFIVGPQIKGADAAGTRTPYGLRRRLRLAGLLGNKHVPEVYLRASVGQRLALLQGLMDTDGTWNKTRRQAVFSNTNKALSAAVAELVASLGWRAYEAEVSARGFGVTVTDYRVSFTPHGLCPFRARADAMAGREAGTAMGRRRAVKSIVPIPSVETQCIAVDSPDDSYLCGRQMVPTHNTSRKSYLASGEPRTPFLGIEEQLAAYRHAEQVISWRDAARLRHAKGRYYHLTDGELGRAVPMPKVDGALGIVVTPEFCHPHEIEAGADQFEQFLFSLEKARWVYGPGKRSIGPVLTPPGRADLKMPGVAA